MNDNDFLKECEEKVSIEAGHVLRNLERFAEEEMLEFDWVVLELGNMIATEDGYCLYPYFHERGEDPLCEIEDFVKWCYFQPGEE